MDGLYIVITILFGVVMGIGTAFAITGIILRNSNKHGDSKGDLYDFNGTSVNFIRRERVHLFDK